VDLSGQHHHPPAQVINPYRTTLEYFFTEPVTAWTPINDATTWGTALGKSHVAFRLDDAARDLVPAAFTFTDATGAALNSLVESNTVT